MVLGPRLGIRTLALALAAVLAPGEGPMAAERGRGEASPILAFYDFETESPSGPDTFRLFEHSRGKVALRDTFQVHGRHALELREGRGDGCFSEFLAFFELRRTGRLLIQFHLLVVDPEDTWNVALAGPAWFTHMVADGHAFWLASRDGAWSHNTAGRWEMLFAPVPFTWYQVEVLYDPVRGRYDLRIFEEGVEAPVVERLEQRNTAGAAPSAIAYFSLIGDLEDLGEAVVYMDDLVIAADPAVRLAPFVAPGRRTYFVDREAVPGPPLDDAARDDLFYEAREVLRGGTGDMVDAALAARLERAGDEAFRNDDLDLAGAVYAFLVARVSAAADRALLKLADVHHRRGDVGAERQARERIYGRLRFE